MTVTEIDTSPEAIEALAGVIVAAIMKQRGEGYIDDERFDDSGERRPHWLYIDAEIDFLAVATEVARARAFAPKDAP